MIGLTIPDNIDRRAWAAMTENLVKLDMALPWAVGDALTYGAERWQTVYEHAAATLGVAKKTLKNWAMLARWWKREDRRAEASHSVHMALLPVYRENRLLGIELLNQAVEQDLTEDAASLMVRAHRAGMGGQAAPANPQEAARAVQELQHGIASEALAAHKASQAAMPAPDAPINYLEAIKAIAGDVDIVQAAIQQEPLDPNTYEAEMASFVALCQGQEFVPVPAALRALAVAEQLRQAAERFAAEQTDRVADLLRQIKSLKGAGQNGTVLADEPVVIEA
jgi:hypothetical protein